MKFHEKNIAILATIETTSGTYLAPAATDAIAATTLSGEITRETGSYTFLGDSLSRDEYSYIKDSYATVELETLQPVLGALNGTLATLDVPLSEPMQACGGAVTVYSAIWDAKPAGTVLISNTNASDSSLSIDYRKTSSDDLVNQKLTKFTGCRGSVDLTANLGEIPKLKFSFKGNASVPTANPIVTPKFGAQLTNLAPTVRQSSIIALPALPAAASVLTSNPAAGTFIAPVCPALKATAAGVITVDTTKFAVNDWVIISGATGSNGIKYNITTYVLSINATAGTISVPAFTGAGADADGQLMVANLTKFKPFCFATLQANNFFGFDYQRYLTGCDEGFGKGGVATDVSISILEDQATLTTAGVSTGITSFDPEANISNFFYVSMRFGTGAGKYITYAWNKLQLADTKTGKIGSYFARDLTFRNTGKSFLFME